MQKHWCRSENNPRSWKANNRFVWACHWDGETNCGHSMVSIADHVRQNSILIIIMAFYLQVLSFLLWSLLCFTTLRFTWRMKLLTGQRGVVILYAYMLLGLGFLRSVAPEFGDLASHEQQLEGTFRLLHASASYFLLIPCVMCEVQCHSCHCVWSGSCMKGCVRMQNLLLSLEGVHGKKRWVTLVLACDFLFPTLNHIRLGSWSFTNQITNEGETLL